jgi:hypothetical protein
VGGISDIKIEGGKTQTFHSDVEETYSNAGGGTVPSLVGGNPALPPIFMPMKKGSKKKSGNTSNLAMFNATKKQFPQLNKLTSQKKSYVSPYSIKSIQKP